MTWWWVLLIPQQPQLLDLPAVAANPYTTQADLAQGKRLFAGRCAGCHGPAGNGGKGANLGVPALPRASTDLALYKVIRYGIAETEMPQFNMAPREIWQVAAFVRTLGQISKEPVTGDAKRGRQLVEGKGGCLKCHGVGIDGGTIGPSLSEVGRRRSPGYLRRKLLDAAGNVPDDFRMVEVTTRDGRKLSGVRLNEDTWSIQLRDAGGKLYSLWKQDAVQLKLQHTTPMPSYGGVFDGDELNAVVAYLAGLRGAE